MAAKRLPWEKLTPFTVPHLCAWAKALELDNGEPWVVEDFFCLFAEDYFAGIPENWLLVPEGNSKTTSLGGFALYLLEFRPYAGIPWAASSREQAEIGYRQAEGFVYRSARLRSFLKPQEGYRRVKNLLNGGRIQVFAADDKTGDGVIPTDAFLDELHRQKDLRLYRTWRGKLLKRGGQMATISTAGEPGLEFEDTRTRIRQETPVVFQRPGYTHCRSAQIAFHEYAVDPAADIEDMLVVKAANPFSAITVEQLAAKRSTPTMTRAHWARFVCNIATRDKSAAVQEAEWAQAARLDVVVPVGAPIWCGLDVGWKWDTTALVPLYELDASTKFLMAPHVLVPPRDGSSLQAHVVKDAFRELHDRNPIHTVVMDMTRAEDMAEWLEDELRCEVVDWSQGNAQAVLDYERFMLGLRAGELVHCGDAVLTRHVLNAITRLLPGGAARFDRPVVSRRSSSSQEISVIDALVAAAAVYSAASTTGAPAALMPPVFA